MKLLKNIYIEILIIIYLSLALVFVEMRRHSIICKGLSVDIASIPAHFFINKADVAQIISDKGFKIKGTNIDKINILKIEKEITLNPSVETTEVHREINGILFVEVKQRNPIARIFNTHNESYYIDEKGAMMPISNKYSVRVLVANGAIKESYALNYTRNILKLQYQNRPETLKDIYILTSYIHHNEFLKSLIEQIYVNEDNNYVLIPKFGPPTIVLGSIEDYEEKCRKLWIIYKTALPYDKWDSYSQIDLQYKNQVVCKKK